jgi:hypothetical protein
MRVKVTAILSFILAAIYGLLGLAALIKNDWISLFRLPLPDAVARATHGMRFGLPLRVVFGSLDKSMPIYLFANPDL